MDLLAVDLHGTADPNRYHIECGVSISGAFSKLTAKPFSADRLHHRVHAPEQRRTIDFFIQHKFEPPAVSETLRRHGFEPGRYGRVIVSWGWTEEAGERAQHESIAPLGFPDILREIGEAFRHTKTYFTDDTLRTLQLFAKASVEVADG